MALQIRRGTDADRQSITPVAGELIFVTDQDGYGSPGQSLYIGDSTGTLGGVLVASSATGNLGDYLTANTLDSTIELNQDLKLNGNDIVGTGDINITGNIHATGNITADGNIEIGDGTGNDTVTITAQVNSSITPDTDTAYDLGTASKRWRNVYASGATIDGQIDAVSINGDVVADNSTVMVDVSANTFNGDLTGDVTGNVNGNLTGNVTGNVDGDTTGYHTGDVKGSIFGDDSTPIVDAVNNTLNGNLTGNVTGNVVGSVTGDLTGQIKGTGGGNVLSPNTGPADADLSVLNILAVGTISGNVSGNLTGNAAGDHTGTFTGSITATGTFDGDITGSVFADDSTPMVDAVSKTLTGDLIGNVTGDVTGNIFTTLIDSADSSTITVTPALLAQSDLTVRNSLIVGEGLGAGPESTTTIIDGNGKVITDTVILRELQTGDPDVELVVTSKVGFTNSIFAGQQLMAGRELRVTNFSVENPNVHAFKVETYNGDPDDDDEFEDPAFYDTQMNVTATKAEFGVPVKFPVYADAGARNTAVPNPEIGMVVIVGTTMQLNTDGTTGGWVSVTTS